MMLERSHRLWKSGSGEKGLKKSGKLINSVHGKRHGGGGGLKTHSRGIRRFTKSFSVFLVMPFGTEIE